MKLLLGLLLILALHKAESREGRITNGSKAEPGQFPWQVVILFDVGSIKYFCGGTILDLRTVITSANCAFEASEIEIIAGAHNIKVEEESQVTRTVRRSENEIVIHPEYNRTGAVENNLAILNLNSPFPETSRIRPVELPRRSDADRNFTGFQATASGWGFERDPGVAIADELRWVENDVISDEMCRRVWESAVTEQVFCTSGKQGRSACAGDDGGAITVRENGRSKVLGIFSYTAYQGCTRGFPFISTKLTAYMEWITEASLGKIRFQP